jgi:hypothetical protein
MDYSRMLDAKFDPDQGEPTMTERKVPTKAGLWYATWKGEFLSPIPVVEVYTGGAGLRCMARPVDDERWDWKYPIPTPEQYAAMEAVVESAQDIHGNQCMSAGQMKTLADALAALDAARKDNNV